MISADLGDKNLRFGDATRGVYLALSGGGFRATAHHMGVLLAYLAYNQHRALYIVNGVSGGAIAVAHFGKWCDDWRNSPQPKSGIEALRDFARPLITLMRLGVRWKVFTSFFAARFRERPYSKRKFYTQMDKIGVNPVEPYDLAPSLFERVFDQYLFEGRELWSMVPSTLFVLTCTDLFTGKPFYITNKGSGLRPHRFFELPGGSEYARIARGACASAAYPPFLPSVKWFLKDREAGEYRTQIPGQKLGNNLASMTAPLSLFLTDGGVSDNLGITFFLQYLFPRGADHEVEPDSQIKFLMAYDAGREPDVRNAPFGSRMRTAWSAFEFLNARKEYLNDFAVRMAAKRARVRYMLFRPILPEVLAVNPPVLNSLLRIRTDFNKFSDTEIYALADSGYRLGVYGMREAGLITEREVGDGSPGEEFKKIMDGLLRPLTHNEWANHLGASGSRFWAKRFTSRLFARIRSNRPRTRSMAG